MHSLVARIAVGGTAQDGVGPSCYRCIQRVRRHYLVHEAQCKTFFGIDDLTGQRHSQRALQADLPRQAMHPAADRDLSDERFGQPETGGRAGDDQVAGKRNLKTAADRKTIHRGDQRLCQIETIDQSGIAGARGRIVRPFVPHHASPRHI